MSNSKNVPAPSEITRLWELHHYNLTLDYLPTPQLIQWLVNARETANCLGHHKASQNHFYAARYKVELEMRGVNSEWAARYYKDTAVYNGAGSY